MGIDLWKQQYESERARILEALGRMADGGLVETVRHLGSTSIPGLHGSSCVDLGMAVWPFPLEAGARSRLEALGYRLVEESAELRLQRYQHESGSFQVFVMESGVRHWFDFLLVNDYLRHNDRACAEISAKKKEASVDKSSLFAELLPDAQQWWIERYGFSGLEAAANELVDAPFEWYVSGGWAVDLFLGRVNRMHHDVDFVISRSSQLELQKYMTGRGWKLITPFEKHLEPWPPHMKLEMPRHQVHALRGDEFVEFLFTDMDDVWHYRRDPLILRSRERMSLRTESGIPFMAPELVLLFKSRNTGNQERPKDEIDFESAFPHLEPERRAWLYWALTATSPEHPWIKRLANV